MKNIITNIFAKLALVAGLATAFTVSALADTVTLVSGSGTSGYAVPPGWTSSGTVEGGSYLKFDNGTITSPEFAPHSGLSFTYTVATFGGGTNHPLTIRILNASTDAVISEQTTSTPTGTTYISTGSPLSLGDVSVAFKIQLYAPTGKGIRLRNYSITGTPASSGSSATATTTTINSTGITNTDVYTSTAAGSLSASVTAGDNPIDGATVTWSGNNNNVATIDASTGAVTLVAAGTVKFTASYAGKSGEYQASSAEYTMTVTSSAPYEQPTNFDINLNNTLFGTTYNGSVSNISDDNPIEGSQDNVAVTYAGGGNHYCNGSQIRFYPNNKLTFDAPSGYVFKEIVFTASSWGITVQVGSTIIDSGTKKWSGSASQVIFTGSGSSGNCQMTKATIKLEQSSTAPSISADDVNIAYNATNGSIAYTVNDEPNPAGAISASTTSDWIKLGSETASPISFTCLANPSGTARTATVTLTYTYNTNETVTKDVTVTQAAAPAVPGISASDLNIAYSATNGSIAFTVNNPVDGGTVSASTEAAWLTAGEAVSTSPISFTCSANSETTSRSATVTLTYTYNTNQTVTTNVTVTQAAAPVIYSTIPALFAVATTTETEVHVTFNNWVVSGVSTNGKNVFVTDNNGNGFVIFDKNGGLGNTYSVGSILSGTDITCNLVLYTGFAEVKNLNASELTITSGGSVTESDVAMADLAGVNTGALVSYSNLTCSFSNNKYYLSDGATTLQVYNALYAFDALEAGKSYNITGVYQQYNTTKEILPRSADDIGEYVSAEPSITVAPATVNAPADGASGTITVTYNNITTVAAEVVFYTSSAATDTATAPAWITAEINTDNNLEYLIEENTTEEVRAAYLKVRAYDDNENEVYSDIITINQAIPVIDYATLPFSFDGGRADIESTDGLTQDGLDSDYGSSPKLKFNGAGDYVILKINERPGTLTFDIKNNSFSGGTFKVQTSEDGSAYTDLVTYTEISGTQNEEFNNLGENVRYIKWVYTEKSSGNVGLGNITLAEYVAPSSDPSITVTPNTASHAASDGSESLTLTYENLEISDASDFAVQFCDAQGAALTAGDEPSWIVAIVEEQNSSYVVSIVIDANESDERSAYFKVYALGNTDYVYSNLVTITQAEYVPDYAVLPFTWNSGYSSTPTGISIAGSVAPKTNYLNFTESEASVIIKINDRPGALSYDLKGNPSSGTATSGTFKVQASVNGTDYVDLKEYTDINNQTHSESIAALPNNIRYIKWVYTNKESGNVALSKISLDEFSPDAEIITLSAALNGGRFWATFYNKDNRYDLPKGAQAFTMNGSKNLYLLGTGSVIPANTAVIIIADHADIVLTKGEATTVEVSGTSNSLVGSNSPVAVSGISGTPYVMGVVGGVIGFYPFSGANIPAFKAYYVNE